MKLKYIIFVLVIVILVLLGFLFWWWQSKKVPVSFTFPEEVPSESLGSELYEKAQNPLRQELPKTNPFEAETNPFKNAYKNPFGE